MSFLENMIYKCSKHLLVVIGALLLASCSSDYVEGLGKGYALARTNKYNHSIIKDSAMVVDTNITDYAFNERYIYGYREKPHWFDVDENLVSEKYGYFILDKDTATLVEGLTEKEFVARAELIGISTDDSVIDGFIKTE
jgi:hypothetical protein